ncbi:MAG TPA: xylose isomerase [Treponema sp.]|nr:xylose isomerase [Treponema sp.]
MAEGYREFAFSTSWNFRNSGIGRVLMEEIVGLGFRKVELNYKIGAAALETIFPMVERGEIVVESVHNVFPDIKDGRFDTDSRLLGYEDEELRARAVELTVRTVEFAAALGAKTVVVHPGIVPPSAANAANAAGGGDYDSRLKALYRERGPDSAEYRSLYAEFRAVREAAAPAEFDRVLRSLEEIAEAVERRKLPVRIGLENRPICSQMPDFSEMKRFLDALEGSAFGFWFDTGHGAMQRHMGFFDDRIEAAALADRLVGMHIHDVDGVDDHFAPYEREGLDDYLELIDRSPVKVLELGKKNMREAVIRGADALIRRLGEYRSARR